MHYLALQVKYEGKIDLATSNILSCLNFKKG